MMTATIALWGPLLGPFVLDLYPYAILYRPAASVLGASGTDGIFACCARNGDQLLSNFTTTYAYEFNDENAPPQPPPPGLSFPLGAFHGAEIQYLFDIGFFFEFTPTSSNYRMRWSVTGQISRPPAIPTAALCRPGRPTIRLPTSSSR